MESPRMRTYCVRTYTCAHVRMRARIRVHMQLYLAYARKDISYAYDTKYVAHV